MSLLAVVLPLAGVLAACSSESESGPNPYLDLVGTSRYLSSNRILTTPGDTLTTRLYAEAADSLNSPLRRLRITVTYEPSKNPIIYPANLFNYDPGSARNDPEFVYLDSMLTTRRAQQALAFQFTFGARTTTGREVWKFEAEDQQQRVASRSYRLTLRNADSALVYHRYSVRLQAPGTAASRSFLALLPGLTLPGFTMRNNPAAQQLVDVVYLPTAAGAPSLSTPADTRLKLPATWTRRATQLRLLSDTASFAATTTSQGFEDVFSRAQAPVTSTGALRRNQVVAFRTADQKYGLILVQEIKTTPTPTLNLQVRIAK
ncbi:hypothetical protein [Hymenobacter elongatus]|uniref:Uncharacterized protein n=1 Tax=Hymenobacter elongatus TaxID=877208 RepID=A0A4Z0PJT8_9BACT|nr:hypothetical protein [Hymenobacter elongatus]TGE15662.1 hypothetical protein E5J99_11800 [Hymenobacter elongatus]